MTLRGVNCLCMRGGEKTIEKYKPIVMSEMLRKWARKFNYHPNDIIDFFRRLGYLCFVISGENNLKEFHEVTEETVETNYYFLHEMKHRDIIQDLCRN